MTNHPRSDFANHSKRTRPTDSALGSTGETMTPETRKDGLAEWIRGWKLVPEHPHDHSCDAHNATINMVIDQLYDPEESGELDELLSDFPAESATPKK